MEMRIDKWLWSVRVFKTRSKATEFCKKGRVFIDGRVVKASRMVTPGTVIQVKRPPVTYGYKVIQITHGRLGAKLVSDFMHEVTSAEQLELIELLRLDQKSGMRTKGTGRPTKKERRSVDAFQDEVPYFLDDEEMNWSEGEDEKDNENSLTQHIGPKNGSHEGSKDRKHGPDHFLKQDNDWDDFA